MRPIHHHTDITTNTLRVAITWEADDHEQEQQHAVEPQLRAMRQGKNTAGCAKAVSPRTMRGVALAFRDVVDTVVEAQGVGLCGKMPSRATRAGWPRRSTTGSGNEGSWSGASRQKKAANSAKLEFVARGVGVDGAHAVADHARHVVAEGLTDA